MTVLKGRRFNVAAPLTSGKEFRLPIDLEAG